MNKNLRPYVISIDWLQFHLHRPPGFCPEHPEIRSLFARDEDAERFSFSTVGHGSKTYRDIYRITQYSEEWGEISINPYSSQINSLSASLKLKNKVLYSPNLMKDVADFIDIFGFRFMGLSRLDLAYDCNEFYGGLTAEHFMRKYEQGDIIKFGSGNGYRQFQQGYSLGWDKITGKFSLMADVAIPEKHSSEGGKPTAWEEEVERQKIYSEPGTLIKLPDERNPLKGGRPLTEKSVPIMYTSTTWGSRSSGHQVQLYNKTVEMQQVAYKHHIAQRWKDYGLDLDRDVWRLEIRITKGARLLENQDNGKRHLLDPRDILCEEQIEQIFWDYAYKYFRFYTLDPRDRRSAEGKKMRSLQAMLAHKDRLKQYRIFSCAERNARGELTESLTHKFVPRTATPQQDYTRAVRQTINVLEGAMLSQARSYDPALVHTQEAVRYLNRVYGIEKRKLFAERELRARLGAPPCEYDIFKYYVENWSDCECKWFELSEAGSAALSWARIRGGVLPNGEKLVDVNALSMTPDYTEADVAGYIEAMCDIDPTQLEFFFPEDAEQPFEKSEPDNPPEYETS